MNFNNQWDIPVQHKSSFEHSGILLVDKPATWTSHDVVNFVRRTFNVKKAGHCGTLDPAATGLLVLVIGHATKLSSRLMDSDKGYAGRMQLGIETDSQDMDGQIVSQKDPGPITEEAIASAFSKFKGELDQTPPMFSATKKDGKKLYELARKGVEVEREPKKITIHALQIEKIEMPFVDFSISCSKGTYVRTICHDIGRQLGCGATLHSLRRTASGAFKVENAHSVDQMRKWSQDELLRALIAPFGEF